MNATSQANIISPALVTQKAAQRLPRWALFLFCAAYVIPGLLGRDPWKNEDIASFGQMWSIALGQAPWLHPNVGGILPSSGGILPYWLGGAFIAALSPWVDPTLAARLPFAMLLCGVMALTWYSTYHLARTKAAQPQPLAFGGEAKPQDYARAMADGALLALIATLGLLQLGHETTPELLQLLGSTLFLYSLAAVQAHPIQARCAAIFGLAIMAASGSPTVATLLGLVGLLVSMRSTQASMKAQLPWIASATILSIALASALTTSGLSGWAWRLETHLKPKDFIQLLTWFTWPTLPLAGLTVWHWRRQISRRHIAVPLITASVGLLACIAMGGNEQALLTALPALAVLAAFALPILQRSLGSALDWFSVFFFTLCAVAIWIYYIAMQTGYPKPIAANIQKLVPGMQTHFSLMALAFAGLGTVLWISLVRWRTARNAHALWKSLVLPAGGVALCWLLFMTLWLPLLDQSKSYRLLISRMDKHVAPGDLICAPGASVGLLTAMEYFGGLRVNGDPAQAHLRTSRCSTLALSVPAHGTGPQVNGWIKVGQYNQRTRNSEQIAIYKRIRSNAPGRQAPPK